MLRQLLLDCGKLVSISEAEEKLRVEGAWTGVLELNLEEWKVPMLREEVAKQSGCSNGPQMINLTSSGKVLKDVDGTEKLSQLGLRNNCKVMATKISVDQGKLKQEFFAKEERCKRHSRLNLGLKDALVSADSLGLISCLIPIIDLPRLY
ncbi:OLC1v1004540C1 [Oldenlandia corymbosa var. corymbosa]|uniref:OLC1v1004540C1 n=1 Tax=Oldenlandia corymbosa var. corymbosa TaxID=529605 RepID=A0AAV1DEJ7_OLDCO|nr:OLC1v1004540C1 [Oldenlandia corymbosa var. corymbosa]